ncbi:MAG: MFS transporter [Lactobacillaceae bacterium]|jgi:UMF1 family MFS transporter|nr:MFS transporter [Lactobacillaceae bacterium]
MQKYTKQEWSWIFYDWANSAYGIIVVTAVLPIWLTTIAGQAGISATHAAAYWGYANSIATLLGAVLSPILGALADYKGFKSKLFYGFTIIGILGTLALAIVPDANWQLLLAIFVLSFVGYSSANVFYDGFITDVTDSSRMDRVSSAGYGFGYLGGLLPFAIFIGVRNFMSPHASVVFAFIFAAIWWAGFTVPFVKNVEQKYALAVVKHPVKESLKRLWATVKELPKHPRVFWFLLSYFFYIDGVNTIFTMASSFALAIGVPSGQLIIVLLFVQLVAFPFSLMFGWLADIFGNRKVLVFGMFIYLGLLSFAFFVTTPWEFWIVAFFVGMAQGGMQALSRSYLGQLVPKERSNEFFGFFNIFGKFSAIIGPALYGIVVQISGRSQTAAGSLIVLFIIGLILFMFIPKDNPTKATV